MHPLDTLMREEYNRITTGKQYAIKYNIKCTIHAPNEDIPALFVMDFSLLRDYINNFSDVLTITAVFGAGTVTHRIMPHGKKLEATVTLRPLVDVPEYIDSLASKILEYRYKAVLYETGAKAVEANQVSDASKTQRDVEDVTSLKIQLVNPLQEQLRVKTFGGLIREAIPIIAIRTLLTKYSKLGTVESDYSVKGVDMVPGYSTEVKEHIIVPHLTPIIRVPLMIEKIVGGIYPTGFQYYLQKNLWYIFSPFNIKAFEKSEYTLTVININKDKLAQLEKTFRLTPTQLIVLSTGEVKFDRLSDRRELNDSLGTRFVEAKNVMGKFVESGGFGKTGENKLIVARAKNTNEFATDSEHDITLVKESNLRITSKVLYEYGKLAYRKGAMLQFVWENSADDLIIPGMPIRFIYMDGRMPKQVYGTVAALESTYISETQGIKQKKFSNHTVVSCFVEDVIKKSEML